MAYLDKFSTLNQVDRDPSLTDAFDASKSTEIVSNNLATVYNGATLAVENLGLPSAVFNTHSLATAATGAVPGAVTGTAAFYNFANQLSNVVRADLATDKGLLSGSVFKLDSGNKNVYTASASATDAAGKVTTVKVTEATAGTDPFNGNGSIKEVVNYTGTQGEKLTVNNAISAVTTANSDSYNTARSEILTGKNVLGVLNTTDAHSHSQNAGSEVLKNASAMSYNYTDSNLTVIANIKDAYARNTTSNGVETIQQSDAANVSYNLTVPAIVTAPVGTPTHKVSLVYSAARNVAQTTDAAGVQKTTVITSLPSFKFSDTTTGLSITANSVTTNVTGQAEKAIGTGVKISVADTTGTYSGSLYSATVKGNFAEFFDQAVFDKAALPATNISAEFAVATGVSGLATPVAKAGTNATATFIGTNADDAITVNSVIDIASKKDVAINGVVNGGAGNDVITGGKGNDVLTGGIGDDALIGGDGNDTLNSFGNASGNDVLTGGNGNDIFNFDQNDTITDFVTGETLNLTFAYSKNDLTNAEKAEEEAAFAASGKGVTITLVATSAKTSDVGVTVDLASVKKVPFIVTGSDKNDVITVTGSSNDSGNDVINGGKGNDIINAGRGADVLTGGAGNDTFVYLQESVAPAALPAADKEARVAGLTDTITDFVSAAKGAAAKPTQANDKIDLSAIDAKPSTAVVTNAVTKVTTGEDAFTFIGTNAFTAGIGGEGQLRYDADTNTLQGNTDSNPATIEFALVLTGVKAADLAAVDFVL